MEHISHFTVIQFFTVVALALSQKITNEQCSINQDVVVADADVRFGLIMSLRKNDQNTISGAYSCSLLSREPLQNYLAVEWVVERLNKANNGTGYIPGIKIGFYGMDDCRSAVYSSRNALSFLDAWVPSPSSRQNCIQNEQKDLHIGLIGPSRSSTATRVASLLRDVQVPIISMSATSAELSNTADYPTFFRTVPSDDHQMNMIIEILEQMSWTYVAVVYSNDDYGNRASVKLSELASKKGICIFKSFALGADTPSFNSELVSLFKAAKGNSIAIPFIGNRDNAEQFLWTLDNLRVDNINIRYGFHLILSESSNTDVSIYNNKNIGFGTMAIGGSNIFLNDLYQDVTEKVNQVKNGTLRHPLIEQYNSENKNGIPLVSPNLLDAFVPLTVHAVFALVEALRVEHKAACGGVSGICPSLKQHVQNGKMLEQVKTVKVEYEKMEKGVPPDKFKENNYTVSFDKNGDIKLDSENSVYLLYQYRGKQTYEPIGSYSNGHTVLDMDKIKFVTLSGQSTSSLATSVCSQNCADCLSNNIVPMAFQEGDVYILGVFSIHEAAGDNPFSCGQFRNIGNDAIIAEGFLYAVNELRNITGIKFGAVAIDDCYSPLRSTSILSQYFSDLIKSNITVFSHPIPKEKFVGVVACRSSGCTIPTARFFMPMNLPVVSYSASSADLDSKIDFPYFLRTVPSDVYQAKVMLDIVKTMKWEYVGLLYVKNNYGAKGMEEFKKAAMKEDSGVCVAPELGINEKVSDSDGSDFRNICVQFISKNIKVVVFFGIDDRFRNFLSFMEKENFYGKFIFMASEDWGVNLNIYNSGQKSARGSLTFKLQDIQLESHLKFKNHLASKSPTTNDSNIWFAEFWQNEFSCNLKGTFINSFEKDCDQGLKLTSAQLDIRAGEQRVTQVMNAVYALGKGLAEAKKSLCENGEFPCSYFYKRANQVVDYIKKQTRLQGDLMYKVFDKNGNGALGFDVYNIQQVAPGVNPYVKVGSFNSEENVSWNPTVFQKENIKFYSETGNVLTEITSKCSGDLCQHCPAPRVANVDETSEQSSSSMSNYRQSDILIISLIIVLILAVLVAICAVIICFTTKYRNLKKSLESCKEEIYDEPDRVVYQPYTDTHGIRFANAMNPYPIINSVGVSNFGNSTSNVSGGVNNLAFINDNSDSVSQVIAMGNRKTSVQTDPQNRRSNPLSLVSSGQLMSPHSSRPLPVSPIGQSSSSRNIHGMENRVIYPSMSAMGSQNDPASMKRSLDSQSLANEQVYLVTSNSVNGNNAFDPVEGIVYYMQGPNGQLAPHISSSLQDASVQQGRLPLQQQSSVHSQNSLSSSTVNPSYGPYSTAAHHRQNVLKNLEQQMTFSNSNPTAAVIYGNPPTVGEYPKITTTTNARQLQSFGNNNGDEEIVYSPVLYASPSRDTQESTPHNIATSPHYQQPTSHTNQHTRTGSVLSSTSQPTSVVYNTEGDQDNFQHHAGQMLQEQHELSQSPDRSPDQSRHSMISSSFPDVVGESSLAADDLQRQISLESIDLTSSKDSLDDLDINIKYPGKNKNDNAILRAITALSGNISKV